MKKHVLQLFSFLIAILLFSCTIVPVFAAHASVQKTHVVRVGYFSFEGYHEIDENGNYSGYGYEYLQKLSQYTDWVNEYVGYDKSWSEMQEMLENGEIDLLTSAQKTEERMLRFDYSDLPIGTSSTILTVKEGNTKYSAGDYKNYNGMRVGMIEGNSRN